MTTETEVRTRPILFSAPMIRAILAGQKTMTRRIAHAVNDLAAQHSRVKLKPSTEFPGEFELRRDAMHTPGVREPFILPCPYGKPGDRLILLSTWGVAKRYDTTRPSDLPKSVKVWTHFDGEKPEWVGKCRPGRFMPNWMRDRMPRAEVVETKVERAQNISEADAIAEGFDQKTCAGVFRDAAGKSTEPVACCWVERESDGFDEGGHYCIECAEKEARKLTRTDKKKWVRRGGMMIAEETDGPAYCERCGRVLCVSLTAYGIERELFIESNDPKDIPRYPVRGLDAAIVREIAEGMGDLRDEHLGRLAQIGFATLWESINGPESWTANPFVWVVSFRRIDQ